MALETIALKVEGTRIAWSVKLNNVLIFADRWYKSSLDTAIVNHWVIPGTNSVSINVHVPWDDPDRAERSFKLEVLAVSAEMPEPKVMASYDWKWTDGEIIPINYDLFFSLSELYPIWSWLNTDTLAESQNIFSDAIKLVELIHQRMSEKNLTELERLLEIKALDFGSAYNVPREDRLKDQSDFFTSLFSDPSFQLAPLNISELNFEFEANHHLLKITDKAGKPPIQTVESPTSGTFALPIYFASFSGQLKLVR